MVVVAGSPGAWVGLILAALTLRAATPKTEYVVKMTYRHDAKCGSEWYHPVLPV